MDFSEHFVAIFESHRQYGKERMPEGGHQVVIATPATVERGGFQLLPSSWLMYAVTIENVWVGTESVKQLEKVADVGASTN